MNKFGFVTKQTQIHPHFVTKQAQFEYRYIFVTVFMKN